MPIADRLRQMTSSVLVGNPTAVPHAQPSMILYDDHGPPTDRLLDLALAAVSAARTEDMRGISARMPAQPRWPDIWPGEHYKLLAGIVRVMRPSVIVEIGTYQGLSALALAQNMPSGSRLHTFDVIAHDRIPGNVFRSGDFDGGRIVPLVADLTQDAVFQQHRALMARADLIFVDAAKDGRMERVFLRQFETMQFANKPIVMFDDIRVWNMLGIWRDVRRPKLDLTSFGHWSGTGLIDWMG